MEEEQKNTINFDYKSIIMITCICMFIICFFVVGIITWSVNSYFQFKRFNYASKMITDGNYGYAAQTLSPMVLARGTNIYP